MAKRNGTELAPLEVKRLKVSSEKGEEEEDNVHSESDFFEQDNDDDDNNAAGQNRPDNTEFGPSQLSTLFANPDQRLGLICQDWPYVQAAMPSDAPFELFQPQDSSFEMDYYRIVGMLPIKDILENSILPPMQRPEEFQLNGKQSGYPVPQAFYFYGRHGTGIRTLIKSFCHEVGANLIIAKHPGFDARSDLRALYNKAAENQPCVVLMIDAEVQFGPNSPNVTLLTSIMETQKRQGMSVYTIFRAENRQNVLAPQIQEFLECAVWSGVPDSLELIQLWALALQPYVKQLPTRQELNTMASNSEHCLAANIVKCVRNSVSRKVARQNKERTVLSAEQRAFNFTDVEFQHIPRVGKRVTLFDPFQVNVAPFCDYNPGNMPPPALPHRS